jgi:alpha-ketoglutarate-dependent taurine dioxygenase
MSGFAGRRRALTLADSQLTRTFEPDGRLAVPIIEPAISGVRLTAWATQSREELMGRLARHGGVLLRGFELESIDEFQRLVEAVSGTVMDYSYRSTPRTRVSGRIYTSTEYPPDQHIPLHSEMSYTRAWPGKIFFYSVQVAEQGGETPIADNRQVFANIDPALRQRFERDGVMYVRNYGNELDLPWQEVFQTRDQDTVEKFCAAQGIRVEWRSGGRLRTRQVCQAVVHHPVTGEAAWFNQAHLFHVSNLPAEVREALLGVVALEDLPRNAFFGDGSPLGERELDLVRAAYAEAEIVSPWQAGDILMLDNVLMSHGRRPFVGPRQVLVAMSEPSPATGVAVG